MQCTLLTSSSSLQSAIRSGKDSRMSGRGDRRVGPPTGIGGSISAWTDTLVLMASADDESMSVRDTRLNPHFAIETEAAPTSPSSEVSSRECLEASLSDALNKLLSQRRQYLSDDGGEASD
ncbi:unnamed protein product [Hydatigera taeniaeformis]|uniref:Uncharacterized protein n=1 Tax=Hydatigena taeniaeformis TaxID=6205 RepID=A0A0R3X9C0_HYDTA|nr:unnamed protein product [Hydatigera taeniaeformis]